MFVYLLLLLLACLRKNVQDQCVFFFLFFVSCCVYLLTCLFCFDTFNYLFFLVFKTCRELTLKRKFRTSPSFVRAFFNIVAVLFLFFFFHFRVQTVRPFFFFSLVLFISLSFLFWLTTERLCREFNKVLIVHADNVGSKQMQTIRISLRGKVSYYFFFFFSFACIRNLDEFFHAAKKKKMCRLRFSWVRTP